MRTIDTIIVHCTATYPEMDIGAIQVKEWHLAKGWSDCGYHWVIKRDGTIEHGRPLANIGAHCKGYNDTSIGVALAGGLAHDDKPACNFRTDQYVALEQLVADMQRRFDIPDKNVWGHEEVSSKACPCFDVRAWMK